MNTKNLTIFLMTEKGYYFLVNFFAKYGDLFKLIVIGSDNDSYDDFHDQITNFCKSNGLNYIKRGELKKIETDYCLAISWRWIINHPNKKLIILHDSILPKYRGFIPVVNALINNESEIGVTAIFGESNYDCGPIIYQSKTEIKYPIKINDAIKINLANYHKVAEFVLDKIKSNTPIISIPQDNKLATYSLWRDNLDYFIPWKDSSEKIKRFVDAVGFPYKFACSKVNGELVRITDVSIIDDVIIENRDIGKVLFLQNSKPVIVCGDGLIRIEAGFYEVENKKNKKSIIPFTKLRSRFG